MSKMQILLIAGVLGYIIYNQQKAQAQSVSSVTLVPRGSSGNMTAIAY